MLKRKLKIILATALALTFFGGSASASAQTNFSVVNERGIPQAFTEVYQNNQQVGSTDSNGNFSYQANELSFTRGAEAPEGVQGVHYVAMQQSQATIILPSINGPTYAPATSDEELWLLGQINAQRQTQGLQPVQLSQTLTEVADRYSQLLSINQLLSEAPLVQDGSNHNATPALRATDAGWPTQEVAELVGRSEYAPVFWRAIKEQSVLSDPDLRSVGIGLVGDVWTLDLSTECSAAQCRMSGEFGDPTLQVADQPAEPEPEPEPEPPNFKDPQLKLLKAATHNNRLRMLVQIKASADGKLRAYAKSKGETKRLSVKWRGDKAKIKGRLGTGKWKVQVYFTGELLWLDQWINHKLSLR